MNRGFIEFVVHVSILGLLVVNSQWSANILTFVIGVYFFLNLVAAFIVGVRSSSDNPPSPELTQTGFDFLVDHEKVKGWISLCNLLICVNSLTLAAQGRFLLAIMVLSLFFFNYVIHSGAETILRKADEQITLKQLTPDELRAFVSGLEKKIREKRGD